MIRAGVKRRVDRQLVQRVEAVRRILPAERVEILAGLVEPVDVVARIAVGDVDVAVRRDVQSGEQQRQLIAARVAHLVLIGNGCRSDRHDDGALERHLDDGLAPQRGAVDELAPGVCAGIVLVNDEAVEVAGRAGHVAQELAVGREHLQARGRILHAHIHVAGGTDRDVAVLVAELCAAVWQFQPVGSDGVVTGGRRSGDETDQREKNEAAVLHDGAIMALT